MYKYLSILNIRLTKNADRKWISFYKYWSYVPRMISHFPINFNIMQYTLVSFTTFFLLEVGWIIIICSISEQWATVFSIKTHGKLIETMSNVFYFIVCLPTPIIRLMAINWAARLAVLGWQRINVIIPTLKISTGNLVAWV